MAWCGRLCRAVGVRVGSRVGSRVGLFRRVGRVSVSMGVGGAVPLVGRRSLHASAALARRQEFLLADIGEGIAEVQLLQWFVSEGDTVSQFQPICEVQSDKANVEITSRFDGVVTSVYYNVGDMVPVGSSLITLDVPDTDADKHAAEPLKPSHSASPEAPTPPDPAATSSTSKALMTPAVRRLVKENELSVSDIRGTGASGRILKEDVLAFLANRGSSAPPASSSYAFAASPSAASAAVSSSDAVDVVEKVDGIGRVMVQSMEAANQVPTLTLHEEVDLTQLVAMRKQLNQDGASPVKLTFMPFYIKAASLALLEFPRLNSWVSEDCTALTLKAEHNISLAMDTPRGLMVPNIKSVQNRSVLGIAEELVRLQRLGQAGKLGPADLAGGTFSISNIGAIGGIYAAPLLVVPQVVIGAIGRLQTLPRFAADASVQARSVSYVSWSADHRMLDGATVARFSNAFRRYVENPAAMLLHLR